MSDGKRYPLMGSSDLRGHINVGDLVTYDSTAEANNAKELCRSSSATIEATGRAIKVYAPYVLLELRNGVRECANRGNIHEVVSFAD